MLSVSPSRLLLPLLVLALDPCVRPGPPSGVPGDVRIVRPAAAGGGETEGGGGTPGEPAGNERAVELALSEGAGEPPEALDRTVQGEALDAARIAELLARVEGETGAEAGEADAGGGGEGESEPDAGGDAAGATTDEDGMATGDFRVRPASPPPPRTGATILDTLGTDPGAPAPPEPEPGALEIVRFAPEGEVELAPHLSVTFSRPMVPLTSLDALAARDVPVTITPQPPGAFRWVGTTTLVFEPEERFPMASAFLVEVPAGTEATDGSTLTEDHVFRFGTPPPGVVAVHPSGGEGWPLQPLHAVTFDQRVDPRAVGETITLIAGRDEADIRILSWDEAEDAADDEFARGAAGVLARAPRDRTVLFVPAEPLPAGREITVRVGPGTPSAEGPRTTGEAHAWTWQTYGPLALADDTLEGWPGQTVSVPFNNALDPDSLSESTVGFAPPIEHLVMEADGRRLLLFADTRPGTSYTLTIDGSLRDRFGQRLGEPASARLEVRTPDPWFAVDGPDLQVLDPFLPPRLVVRSADVDTLRVELRSVTPDDWLAFTAARSALRETGFPRDVGERLRAVTLEVEAEPHEPVRTVLGLEGELPGDVGHLVAVVDTADVDRARPRALWLQRTRLAVDVSVDGGEVLAWVSRLTDGRPVAGATVELSGGRDGARAVTGADGLARLPLPDAAPSQILVARHGDDVSFVPEAGWTWRWRRESSWVRREGDRRLLFYVFDDRGTYKPGESARVKGWLRVHDGAEGGDLLPLPPGERSVDWVCTGPRGTELDQGTAEVDPFGGFHFTVEIPPEAHLGSARLRLTTPGLDDEASGASHSHRLSVQEFRRPEYEVTLAASSAVTTMGEGVDVTASARTYAGGGLPGAPVDWTVRTSPAAWAPAGWDGFSFGTWTPWWERHGGILPGRGGDEPVTFASRTDAKGGHVLHVDVTAIRPPRATSVSLEAAVTDVDRQRWAGTTTLLVHPASLYVGMRAAVPFVSAGEPWEVDLVVTDLDGRAVPGRSVTVTAWRRGHERRDGRWVEVRHDERSWDVTSGEGPVSTWLEPGVAGSWTVSMTVHDEQGRSNVTERLVWVSGQAPGSEALARERLQIVPDRPTYAPGEVARLLVVAPFADGEGLLTVRRSGIVATRRFSMDGDSHTLEIPVREDWLPNVTAFVELAGQQPRTVSEGERRGESGDGSKQDQDGGSGQDGAAAAGGTATVPPRPAFAAGSVTLEIPPEARRLTVEAAPRQAVVEPGATTPVDVTVTGAGGEPVADVSVAVVVVDEAILALSGGHVLADPLSVFHPARPAGTSDARTHDLVQLADPDDEVPRETGDAGALPHRTRGIHGEEEDAFAAGRPPPAEALRSLGYAGGDAVAFAARAAPAAKAMDDGDVIEGGGLAADETSPLALRSRFDALALFLPDGRTDAEGRLTVPVDLPDTLTRYRVTAVAVDDGRRAGHGESTVTARLPLMVRAAAPRFLNAGDRCALPVVVTNRLDEARTVDVAVALDGLRPDDVLGRRVTVPADDRVEVRFEARAELPGTGALTVVAADVASPGRGDATRVTLPVWTPATAEAFAVWGELDEGAVVQPVAAPPDVAPAFGGLSVVTSSTALASLTDAFLAVHDYPFGCAEQRASRLLATAALADVLAAFDAEGLPDPEALDAMVEADLDALLAMQNGDGGFGFWRSGGESHPFVSVHVAHALARTGEDVDSVESRAEMRERALGFAADVDGFMAVRSERWSLATRRTVRAYASSVLAAAGRDGVAPARGLLASAGIDGLSLEALGWLLQVLADDRASAAEVASIVRHLGNRVAETAGAAHFVTSYEDGDHVLLHGARRTDAVVLSGLLAVEPGGDLPAKLVRGLLGHRVAGRWSTTQENVFALLALRRYFDAHEASAPDFTARAWVGELSSPRTAFRGRSADRHRLELPMASLLERAAGGEVPLVLAKEGPGRLYYRFGLRYAPADLSLAPREAGFAVERRYEPIDDPEDVVRGVDGSWRLRLGATVRVRLTVVAPWRRHHVALVDPLPAGLEALNPALAVTPEPPADRTSGDAADPWRRRGWWRPSPWVHHDLRDERAESFALALDAGVHEWSYVARVTTPGTYLVPPARAEEMYAPETFGRTGTDRVLVR